MQFSALWDSLPYSSPSTPDCSGAPLGEECFRGPSSIPGRFWRTGVPSFRRCSTESLHSGSVKYRDVVWPLHWPLHYRVRGWGRLKKKKKNKQTYCKFSRLFGAIFSFTFKQLKIGKFTDFKAFDGFSLRVDFHCRKIFPANARKILVRKWNKGNEWKATRKRKSWARFNFYVSRRLSRC